jgi:hypothetical protein
VFDFPFVCADIDGEEISLRCGGGVNAAELQHLLHEILSCLEPESLRRLQRVLKLPPRFMFEKQSCELARILQFSRRFSMCDVYVQQQGSKKQEKNPKGFHALLCCGTCDSSHFFNNRY